ncbi:MAG: hypothetical protein HUJ76_01405 [Parasporobacterium sp.]|nr:hypothetical protein [Parasporobacterium sp.]
MKNKIKINLKDELIRLAILLVGLLIAHLGVSMFLLTELGADPFNVMIAGISSKLPISHGITHMIISILIIIVLLFVDRSYIRIGTIACMFLGGPIIDMYNLVLAKLINGSLALWIRLVIVVIACAILAFGMTLVITSKAGTGPNDLVAVVLSDKIHKKFSIVRIIVDLIFFGIGALLGGTFGIGTLVCAFVVGLAAGLFMPFSRRIVSHFVKEPEAA